MNSNCKSLDLQLRWGASQVAPTRATCIQSLSPNPNPPLFCKVARSLLSPSAAGLGIINGPEKPAGRAPYVSGSASQMGQRSQQGRHHRQASLREGTMRRRLGLHTPFLGCWSFAEEGAPQGWAGGWAACAGDRQQRKPN